MIRGFNTHLCKDKHVLKPIDIVKLKDELKKTALVHHCHCSERYPLQIRHKQDCSQQFNLLLPQAAVLILLISCTG